MSRFITDELNAETPQGKRERLRLYRDAVDFIAYNDDPGSSTALNPRYVRGYCSVLLVAQVFGKTTEQVAAAVVRIRRKGGP